MGEAFDGVDAYCWASRDDPGTSPDEAHDCIYMMHSDDWAAVREAWRIRPSAWRTACAYILGYGPLDECLPLLEHALFDEEQAVATEAAVGYASQLLEHECTDRVTTPHRERLTRFVESAGGSNMEEVVTLLAQLNKP